jgi:S-adenosyl-L-methionine hydrolase (adenosine-forming)
LPTEFLKQNSIEQMAIVTLTTSFGLADSYVGTLKGKLYSAIPNVRVVDISHIIQYSNLLQAAFVARHACVNFPAKSIHIISAFSTIDLFQHYVITEFQNQYFFAPDNGILHLMFGAEHNPIFSLKNLMQKTPTFPELDLVEIIAKLALGASIEEIGELYQEPKRLTAYHATSYGNNITGSVLHIDIDGNAITNIDKEFFERSANGRKFSLETVAKVKVSDIKRHYSNQRDGEVLAIFNSMGLLEIAMRNGKLNKMLTFKVGDSVKIIFE